MAAGAAPAISAPFVSPAFADTKTLSIVQWSHFVPAYDKWFDKFTKDTGIAVNLVEAGSGDRAPFRDSHHALEFGVDPLVPPAAVKEILRRPENDRIAALAGAFAAPLAGDRPSRNARLLAQQGMQFAKYADALIAVHRLVRLGVVDPVAQAIDAAQQHISWLAQELGVLLSDPVDEQCHDHRHNHG